jgi:hypothetical protein
LFSAEFWLIASCIFNFYLCTLLGNYQAM